VEPFFTLFPHKEQAMLYVGIDLHKKTITLCVVNQARDVLTQKRFLCAEPDKIRSFFAALGAFQAVVEATASYEWLWEMLEPLANRLVLAHPKKLRVIAESTRKSDKLDARVLAEFLALDMIPQAYRPTPRQREHRVLVRQRCYLQRRITSVRNKIRRILSDYNADRSNLFTGEGRQYLAQVSQQLAAADRFVIEQLVAEFEFYHRQLDAWAVEMKQFVARASLTEAEARRLLQSIPGVGPVTTEVVLSELADPKRFRSARCAVSYAGMAPGHRESAGKRKELHIERTGSKLLRWVLVESAWQLVRYTARWRFTFTQLSARIGRKKAITAIARRLLTVMMALLKKGQPYQHAYDDQAAAAHKPPPQPAPHAHRKPAADLATV
jgi:transposase